MACRNSLTAQRLRKLLHYDPLSGIFTNLVMRGTRAKAGAQAGRLDHQGYMIIKIDSANHLANRLAFLYMTGEWPKGEADHEDHDRANNKWGNLRDLTHAQNLLNKGDYRNNKLGVKGVSRRFNGRFVVKFRRHKVLYHVGTFDSESIAQAEHAMAIKEHSLNCEACRAVQTKEGTP